MILDAFQRLAQAYPGGVAAVAQRLDKHPGTLRHELCPPAGSSAKLGVEDALQIMRLCQQLGMPGALVPLDKIEAEFDRHAVPLMVPRNDLEADLAVDLAKLALRVGQLAEEVAEDARDGEINANELRRIEANGEALLVAAHTLLAHCRAKHEASKPANLQRVA